MDHAKKFGGARRRRALHVSGAALALVTALGAVTPATAAVLASAARATAPYAPPAASGAADLVSGAVKHRDAAHWSQTVDGQVTAISDDLAAWVSSNQSPFQAMATDATSQGSGTGDDNP